MVPIVYEEIARAAPRDPLTDGFGQQFFGTDRFYVYEFADGSPGITLRQDAAQLPPATPAGATLTNVFGGLNYYALGTSGLGPPVCQFEGRTAQYVANWQGTVSFNYQKEVSNLGFIFKPTLDVLYNSGYETTVRLDSDVAQEEYTEFNARLSFESLEEAWEIAIVGQNLTNEKVVTFASEVPIATRIQGSKSHFGFVRPPRSVGLNFRYKLY